MTLSKIKFSDPVPAQKIEKQKNSVEKLEETLKKFPKKTEQKEKEMVSEKKKVNKLVHQSRKFNIQITGVPERSENIEGEIIIEVYF